MTYRKPPRTKPITYCGDEKETSILSPEVADWMDKEFESIVKQPTPTQQAPKMPESPTTETELSWYNFFWGLLGY